MNTSRDFQDFLSHLTENARLSLQHADAIARSFGSAYVGTEHILLGVLSQKGSLGAKLLDASGVNLKKARTALKVEPREGEDVVTGKGLSEAA